MWHANGLTANPTARRVLRLDQRLQPSPWHHLLYLTEKILAPRHTLILRKFAAGKALLLGRVWMVIYGLLRMQDLGRIDQRFPGALIRP